MESFVSACFGRNHPKNFLETTFSPVGALEESWLLVDKKVDREPSPELKAVSYSGGFS